MTAKSNPEAVPRSFKEELFEFSASSSNELTSTMSRLDSLIGYAHWLSVGGYKEALIRHQLSRRMPKKFDVGTGFVMSASNGEKRLSKQIDVLIWNSADFAPFFRQNEFVIIPPEACKAAIEIKGHLDHQQLRDALANLDSLTPFYTEFGVDKTAVHRGLFAFSISSKLRFPESVFASLRKRYQVSHSLTVHDRLQFSGRCMGRNWQNVWIDSISVLGSGGIAVHRQILGSDSAVALYAAFQTSANGLDDTYGFMERAILAELLLKPGYPADLSIPGSKSLLFSADAELLSTNSVMVVAESENVRDEVVRNTPFLKDKVFSPSKGRRDPQNKTAT